MRAHGARHALLEQPNSGYGSDNRCMLDAIARHPDIFKGIAIADPDADLVTLRDLKSRGVVGIAFNATYHGTEYYARADGLFEKLAELGMFVDLQVEREQLLAFAPWIERIPVRVLIDHCGRPTVGEGPGQAETTPGPLIMVVQFVGFLGAHNWNPCAATGRPGRRWPRSPRPWWG
jgi:predicted TIM-barrel fold metal-dependent hydrolase